MNGGGMTSEQYLQMCEQMGWEPKEEEMPIDPGSLSEDCQYVLQIGEQQLSIFYKQKQKENSSKKGA